MSAQRRETLLEIVAKSRAVLYFSQRFLELVSQRFRPLQRMSHCKIFSVTAASSWGGEKGLAQGCKPIYDLDHTLRVRDRLEKL